jgi:argininosuccinate synthase
MDPVKLVEYCNRIGGENGVGRVDIVEDRLVGMKSRGVYECPGATILYTAHRELLYLVLDRRTFMERQRLSILYAELAYNGEWFTPLRESIDAFVNVTEKKVTGKVRLKLFRGNCTVVGRESPHSLYSKAFATFGASELFGHEHATGFIKIFGLPIEVRARAEKRSH